MKGIGQNTVEGRVLALRNALSQKLADRKRTVVYRDAGGNLQITHKTNIFARFLFRRRKHTFGSAELIDQYYGALKELRRKGIHHLSPIIRWRLSGLVPLAVGKRSTKTQKAAEHADQLANDIGKIEDIINNTDPDTLARLKTTNDLACFNQTKTDITDQMRVLAKEKDIDRMSLYWRDMLGPSGLNIVLDYLKKKPSGKAINAHVCNSNKAFHDALIKLNKSNFQGKIAFLVYSARADDNSAGRHVTPVFIERRKGDTRALIMDSVGNTPKGFKTWKPLYEKETFMSQFYGINVHYKLQTQLPLAEVYASNVRRQHDGDSCSIFSLNDLKQFFSTPNFFQSIEKHGLVRKIQEDHYTLVQSLPPEHMKMTQSLTTLRKYVAESGIDANPSGRQRQNTFTERLEKSYRPWGDDDKTRNAKAVIRKAKYAFIMKAYLQLIPKEELQEVIKRYDSSRFASI